MLSLMVGACATQTAPRRAGAGVQAGPPHTTAPQSRSDAMVSGDGGGLGISGPKTPAELQAIVTAPYALSSPPSCVGMAREIADLDALLGPDVDILAEARNGTSQALGAAMRGVIPYRWVMRLMTGAGGDDRRLRQAILAGTARRSFLKGVRRGMVCPTAASVAGGH